MQNNFQIDSAAISDIGLNKKRPQNEDSYLELRKSGVFAVADGVGGAQAGDMASQMAMEILGEAFINIHDNFDAEEVMKMAIERANEAIYQMSHDLPELSTMATTIVALQIDGNIATIGHVGDSRLYRVDGKGNLFRETQDHSVVEEEVRAGRMTPEQALHHPSRNVISRALGAEPGVEIDMKTIMFEPGTTFLLCSDGITRHIEDFELRQLLSSETSPDKICGQMKSICYERGAEDNLTAVIVRVSSQYAGAENDGLGIEEATVATARPAAAGTVAFADSINLPQETPTRSLTNKSAADTKQISIPAKVEEDTIETTQEEIAKEVKTYRVEEDSGLPGKIVSSALLLLIGFGVGAVLSYFWFRSQIPDEPAAPPLTEMQTKNIAYTAFEDNRRNVDRNPEQYIAANRNFVEDAEDYYLLGRAYLLSGNYPEAKEMFMQAKDRLAMVEETNSKILANEIAMGLAIINAPFAQREFQKEVNPNQSETNFNANTSFNPFPNANATP
ncbi:MAG TPA: PP2C family serine/threonine-protein phosphatase [Pyrinomonadaceae bacterium]|nr:PP2C family serine/threonine-protein phosphatase [Pyrinomonadaceae bacterium]